MPPSRSVGFGAKAASVVLATMALSCCAMRSLVAHALVVCACALGLRMRSWFAHALFVGYCSSRELLFLSENLTSFYNLEGNPL